MSLINNVLDKISEYIQIKGEKIKLEVLAKMATFLGIFLSVLLLLIVGLFFVMFLSLALGAYLNEVLESAFLGYLIVGGVYFLKLIALFFVVRAGKFQKWIEAMFIKFTENTDIDE